MDLHKILQIVDVKKINNLFSIILNNKKTEKWCVHMYLPP